MISGQSTGWNSDTGSVLPKSLNIRQLTFLDTLLLCPPIIHQKDVCGIRNNVVRPAHEERSKPQINYSTLLGILMGGVGMIKEIITSLAMGIFVIVLTIKNEQINRKLALGLLTVFYGLPTLLWVIARPAIKGKTQNQDFGVGYVGMMVFVLLVQIVIGYFIGELIFEKKILSHRKKEHDSIGERSNPGAGVIDALFDSQSLQVGGLCTNHPNVQQTSPPEKLKIVFCPIVFSNSQP
jgi:hypothetical protein